jgi:hypothetical protein
MIGYGLSVLGGIALCGIGIGALAAPRFSSEQYGLATREADALGYVRALGVRDLVVGGIALSFAATKQTDALAAVMGFSVLIGAGDFLVVLRERGTAAPRSLATHAVGTVGLAVACGLLKAGL